MILASHPDANRLAYRIKTALTGKSNGQEVAMLAWQYAEAIEQINAALQQAKALADEGKTTEALAQERFYPHLLEAAQSLDLEQSDEWKERCETFDWRVAGSVDSETLQELESALSEDQLPQEDLFKAYRTALRQKDSFAAYQAAAVIADRYPKEPNAKEQASQQERVLAEQLEQEIKTSHEELIPTAQPVELIERYEAAGLILKKSENPLTAEALQEQKERAVKKARETADKTISDCEQLIDLEDWLKAEVLYLSHEYKLNASSLRADLDPEQKNKLETIGGNLKRKRDRFETVLILQSSIDELKRIMDTPAKALPGRKPKRQVVAEKIEKLKSLEKQAVITIGQIPLDTQADLKTVYARTKRKKLPLILFAGGATAAVIACWLVLANLSERKAERQRQTDAAIAKLDEAETSGNVVSVQQTLEELQPHLETAELESPVQQRKEKLAQWMQEQAELESEYAAVADELDLLASQPDPFLNKDRFDMLVDKAQEMREDLAPDLGEEATVKIEIASNVRSNRIQTILKAEADQVAQLRKEIQLASQNAANAKSKESFERLFRGADTRLDELESLAPRLHPPAKPAPIIQFVATHRKSLDTIAKRWISLDRDMAKLDGVVATEDFLETLKSLQTNDVLPVEDKAAIDQTLRHRDTFASLKAKALLPTSLDAWQEFASDQDYLAAQPDLDAEEGAFLNMLLNDELFSSIYRSTVQYFEGEPEPESTYSVLLVQPISKSEGQEDESSLTFSFSVHGFNEFGQSDEIPENMHLISRPDGSFWGFFYKPSELSEESKYYNEVLEGTIKSVLTGAPRLTLLNLYADIDEQKQLAPAFRAYWQQKILKFMKLRPWKWGLALTVSNQEKNTKLLELSDGDIPERLWLSTIEQTAPSPELIDIFDPKQSKRAIKEARSLAVLYQKCLEGEFDFAGYIQKDGSPKITNAPASNKDALWSLNALTGQVEPLTRGTETVPYSPILTYRFERGGADTMFSQAQLNSEVNLKDSRYRELLPTILR